MLHQKRLIAPALCAVGMTVLILDSKTALLGAQEGLTLCIQTVIPSLFPFFVLSGFLTSCLTGAKFPILKPLGKLCGLPQGSEFILAVGLLGGYPVGAQCISQLYQRGGLSKKNAGRLLAFCSNAGPSFIFGVCSKFFSFRGAAVSLWIIHILSAILVGILMPDKNSGHIDPTTAQNITIMDAFQKALKAMAGVCGWVILFRVIIAVLDRWIAFWISGNTCVILFGILELTNGCCSLMLIRSESARFVICSALLAFGGTCVAMQTAAVVRPLNMGWYFPGKIMQTLFSVALSMCFLPLFCPATVGLAGILTVISTIIFIFIGKKFYKTKNSCSFSVKSCV